MQFKSCEKSNGMVCRGVSSVHWRDVAVMSLIIFLLAATIFL
jgi:hypothetical protein